MSFFSFVKSFFGDDPSQYVETSDWEGFKNDVAVAAKSGVISKEDAQELMGTFKLSIGEKAKKFVEKVESAIRLSPSERVNSRTNEKLEPEAVKIDAHQKVERVREDDRMIGE